MFDLEKEFARVGPEIEGLRRLVAQALKLDLEPGVREHVVELSQAMESSYSEAKRLVPEEAARMKKEVADVQSSIEESRQEIAALEKQIAAGEAAEAPPPPLPVPLPALDPRRGRLLRDELLERFGPPREPAPSVEHRDVHEMASSDFRTAEVPKAPPAAKPPAPVKPQDKRADDKDSWRFSSGAWDKEE